MVRIIVDSTCDLPKDILEKYQITMVPLYIVLGEKEYKDGVDISPKEIFDWSDENKTTPKTAAVSLGDAMDALSPVAQSGDEALIFTISKSMSNTYNAFNMAIEELEATDRMIVVDCKHISVASGLVVLAAVDMAKEGKSAKEIAEAMFVLRHKVKSSFVVDTLTYLQRGGRCSSVASLAGSVLKLHPRIVTNDGVLSADKKYRGKMDVVLKTYAEELKDDLLKAVPRRAYLVSTGCDQAIIDEAYNFLKGLDRFEEILVTTAGSVISSHCGPGTLGIMYIEQ